MPGRGGRVLARFARGRGHGRGGFRPLPLRGCSSQWRFEWSRFECSRTRSGEGERESGMASENGDQSGFDLVLGAFDLIFGNG